MSTVSGVHGPWQRVHWSLRLDAAFDAGDDRSPQDPDASTLAQRRQGGAVEEAPAQVTAQVTCGRTTVSLSVV